MIHSRKYPNVEVRPVGTAQNLAIRHGRPWGCFYRVSAAEAAEVNIDTVRFYERRGVLPRPDRRPSGYRVYSNATVERLRLARALQSLGFTLNEIVGGLGACWGEEIKGRDPGCTIGVGEPAHLQRPARERVWFAGQ